MQKKIHKIITIIILSIFIIFFIAGIILFITYLHDIQKLSIDTTLSSGMECNITTNFNLFNEEMYITVSGIGHEIEKWQKEAFNKKSYNISISFAKNDIYESQTFYSDSISVDIDYPLTIVFVIKNIDAKKYVNFKKFLLENEKNKTIQLDLPDIFSYNSDIYAKAKNDYLKEVEQLKQDKEAMNIAEDYAYYNYKYPLYEEKNEVPVRDTNLRKGIFKVNGISFGHPFLVRPISYMECKAEKDKLGIKYCSYESERYASLCKVCGGAKNLPTPDELVLLANEMYGQNFDNTYFEEKQKWEYDIGYNFYNFVRAKRLNRPYLKYFREVFCLSEQFNDAKSEKSFYNEGFTIFSNKEIDDEHIYARSFWNNGSGLIPFKKNDKTDYRLSPIVGICVDRKNSINIGNKYPIKMKTHDSEVVDDLF